MKIVVAGGSGWLGSTFCRTLLTSGHEVVVLSRSGARVAPGVRSVLWDGKTVGDWASELERSGAVVNFSGQSIASGRWDEARKRTLRASRIEPTAALVSAIQESTNPPSVLVNASAVGYYGDREADLLTESEPPGDDFLARLVTDWEKVALAAASTTLRVCVMRLGIVVGGSGGVLPKLALPFRFFVGGHVGSGNQWVSWVHINDAMGLFARAIDRNDAVGPINVTAPEPVTNRQLSETLARVLDRPSWVPVPEMGLRLVLGELADSLLFSQRAVPAAADRLGYVFQRPTLGQAIEASLHGSEAAAA